MSQNPNPSLKKIFFTVTEKGGAGKTLLALALYDWLCLQEIVPSVVQIDRQQRLADSIGGGVLTIASDPRASRVDPEIEMRRFSPLLDRIEQMAEIGPILVDVGAGEVDRLATWAALVDLEEELSEWRLPCQIFIPFLAESESIRQAAWTADRLSNVLPTANICLVENRRDGPLAQQHPSSAAAEAVKEFLEPWLKKRQTLFLPAIPAGSWRWFEAVNSRFIDVIDMPTTEIMTLTGLPRAESKIVRGDVGQWLVSVFDQLDRVVKVEGIQS